jgi:hypothetical protein
MDNKKSGAGVVTVTTERGGAHTRNRAISRGVLTIRTIRRKTVTLDGGCDNLGPRPAIHLPFRQSVKQGA